VKNRWSSIKLPTAATLQQRDYQSLKSTIKHGASNATASNTNIYAIKNVASHQGRTSEVACSKRAHSIAFRLQLRESDMAQQSQAGTRVKHM